MPHILIIDHYDSFSYNLLHLFQDAGATVDIKKCDEVFPSDTTPEIYDGIVFSPGPGSVSNPEDMGNSRAILKKWQGKSPIFGVCLGHQLIADHCGGTIRTIAPAHGKREEITINKNSKLFTDVPEKSLVMRYHSQIVAHEDFPEILTITATNREDQVMAFENADEKLYGVQFHPESIGTSVGEMIAKNFVKVCVSLPPTTLLPYTS